ncbi:MAG TPA: hypothetical protein VKN63_07800 [Afifellaceae bacterium]|nr:hypothetical protein [Afifellaceae bacterium]
MYTLNDVREVLTTTGRLLTFQDAVPDVKRLGPLYFGIGLIYAWIAGIGRYWDNPRAEPWQYLGLGSVAYVFFMALLIWLLLMPLQPKNWHYRNVLIFVAMTAPPAILYAIPVERFMSLPNAQMVNVWFLAIVALWRVLLLGRFLRRAAGLGSLQMVVGLLLPITLVIVVLTLLNLEHVVFDIMAGIAPDEQSANDAVYSVLFVITFFSMFTLPVLFVAYLGLAFSSVYQRRVKDPQ